MSAGPLARTLAALPAVEELRVVAGLPADDTGWLPATDLHGTPRLDGLLGRVHEHVVALVPAGRRPDVPATVAPAYLLEWYLWAVCSAAALPFVHARRVPSLAPDAVALQLADEGWPDAVALLSPTFACLPGDPDADHPDARVVAGVAALRAALRGEVTTHADAFLRGWGRRGRRGRHALRAAVTDALVDAVQCAAPGGPGAREAQALLAGPARPDEPFLGPVRYTGVGRPGQPAEPFRQRASCCFAYAVPGGEACFSCPRTDDAERARRLAVPAP